MKSVKNILPSLVILLCSTCIELYAAEPAKDTTVNRNVTVEREYKPVIQDAGKINVMPKTVEPKVEKVKARYSDFNLPLNADYNIHTLAAAEPLVMKKQNDQQGYARMGLGTGFNTMADVYCPVVRKPASRLDITLNHLANFGKKALSITKGTLSYSKRFGTFDFYAGQSTGHEYYNYFGTAANDSASGINLGNLATNYGQYTYLEKSRLGNSTLPRSTTLKKLANDSANNTLWRMETVIGFKSIPNNSSWNYHVELQYKMFDSQRELVEHLFHTRGGLNYQNDKYRLGMDMHLYNSMYHAYNSAPLNFDNTYSVLALNPFIEFDRDDYMLRLGVKSSFAFKDEKAFNPSPDVYIEWRVVPSEIDIYGGLTGGYKVNSLSDIFAENRYLQTDIRVNNTYNPYDLFAGIKIKPAANFMMDAYLDYKKINNQYFFINKQYQLTQAGSALSSVNNNIYINRFDVTYSAATCLKAGFRASYNIQSKLNVQLKGAFNNWSVDTEANAWNLPQWEGDVSAEYQVNDDLFIRMNAYMERERFARLGDKSIRMSAKTDINLGMHYNYNERLSLFTTINNLVNNHYQNFFGYTTPGLQLLLGASISF